MPAETILSAYKAFISQLKGNDTTAEKSDTLRETDVAQAENQIENAAMTTDESGDTEVLQRWREYVRSAVTGGQLKFALQVTNQLVY